MFCILAHNRYVWLKSCQHYWMFSKCNLFGLHLKRPLWKNTQWDFVLTAFIASLFIRQRSASGFIRHDAMLYLFMYHEKPFSQCFLSKLTLVTQNIKTQSTKVLSLLCDPYNGCDKLQKMDSKVIGTADHEGISQHREYTQVRHMSLIDRKAVGICTFWRWCAEAWEVLCHDLVFFFSVDLLIQNQINVLVLFW